MVKVNKKWFGILIVLLVISSQIGVCIAAEAQISRKEAENLVSSYSYENEYVKKELTIYFDETPYFVMSFYDENDNYNGSLILDASNGEIIDDKIVSEKIFYVMVRNMGPDFTSSGLDETSARILTEGEILATFENFKILWEEISKDPSTPYSIETETKDVIKALDLLIVDINESKRYEEEMYEIQKDLVKDLDVSKVDEFVEINDKMAALYNDSTIEGLQSLKKEFGELFDSIIRKIDDPLEKSDLELMKSETSAYLDFAIRTFEEAVMLWEEEKKWVEEGTGDIKGLNWEIETMEERLEKNAPSLIPEPTSSPTPTPADDQVNPNVTESPTPTKTPLPVPPEPIQWSWIILAIGVVAVTVAVIAIIYTRR